MQPDQDIPDPHQDWRGPRQQKPRNLLRQVYKWAFTNLLIEPLATISIYAVRLMDKTTGIPYSADELEAKILSQAGAGTTDSLTTSNGTAAAAAGKLGEYVSASDGVSLETDSINNVASIELTAGDWDVGGVANFTLSVASSSTRALSISTISETFPESSFGSVFDGRPTIAESGTSSLVLTPTRLLLTEPTTVYMVASAVFSAGTVFVSGQLTARRVR
jgi:hypothetical protein